MAITKKFYGKTPEGKEVHIFKLVNSKGVSAEIINYGGIVVSLLVPDRNGVLQDVVLGYDTLEGYLEDGSYLGAIIGRHANRIENASFTLNGKEYHLCKNDGENHLHGGNKGFDKVVWEADILKKGEQECLQLYYRSWDGEEFYPGNVDIKVTYTLTEENALQIEYEAVSDQDTVVNLTNHSYFNLAGHDAGSILEHQLKLYAHQFTVSNSKCIPTGEIRDVAGTPMDFTVMKRVGDDILSDDEQIACGRGYDHNWVLDVSGNAPEKAAELYEKNSGRLMEVYTTKPGVQFYTGNFLKESFSGKNGAVYSNRGGLCLETQYFPNALKHTNFPSPILKAGQKYNHITIYKFLVK